MAGIRDEIGYRYPLLNIIPEHAVHAWLNRGQQAEATAGETLFREGSIGGWAYLLRSGRIRVLRSGLSGSDVTVGFLGTGDLFGEYALVPPHRSTATCRTVDRCTFLRLPLGPLKSMLSLVPSVANAIKRWLRLHALTGYLRDRSFLGFMSAETALEFLEDLTPQVFAPGQTIQAERLGDDRWHFLESGEVVLHADGGTFRIGAGDCFGEESLAGLPIVRHAEAVGVVKTRSLFVARFLPQEQGLTASQQTQAGRLALDFPWVGQETPSDCGFASLAMICAAWKRNAPPASWRAEVSSRGLSMAAMKTALERLGFAVRAIRIEALQLRAARTPVILLMREDHYMVLFDAGADGVTIADPATATLRWSWPALESQFSGFALLPQPID